MDFVAVDLGASSTRYTNIEGKVHYIPNNAVFIKDMGQNLYNESYDEVPENNLDVSIWKDGESKFFPMRVLVGPMADRFGVNMQRPSQMKKKVEQPINYMSAILSVALSKLRCQSMGDTINLFVALPPAEVAENKFDMRDNLVGKYTVTFNRIGTSGITLQFTINNVACYEESRLALMQYILDSNYPGRISQFSNCSVLSIDIGASTTDLAIFKKIQYINKTGRTLRIGGNLVRDEVTNKIRIRLGIELPADEVDNCISEGRVQRGTKVYPIEDIVSEGKEKVANQIISRLDTYFASLDMSLDQISYIIVSGGGSMASSYIDNDGKLHETSRPMSDYITDALQNTCDGVEVIYFGDEPRSANIKGLGIIAESLKGEIVD